MIIGRKTWEHLKKSVAYSYSGMILCFACETSFKMEAFIYAVSIPLGIVVSENPRHFILLNGSLVMVMSFELLNSALEKTIDELGGGMVTQRFKYAKDCGSAAVCLAVLLSAALWLEATLKFLGMYS